METVGQFEKLSKLWGQLSKKAASGIMQERAVRNGIVYFSCYNGITYSCNGSFRIADFALCCFLLRVMPPGKTSGVFRRLRHEGYPIN